MQQPNVQPIHSPDPDQIRAHIEHLFGGDLGGRHDGVIEIAWTHATPDAHGRHPLCHASAFGTDEIDEAVECAVRENSIPGQSVYIGAALRKPGASSRCYDEDFYALTAAYADLDDIEAAQRAKYLYDRCPPTLVVITGRHPHLRAQLWWRLEEPITDPDQVRAQMAGLAKALNGDAVVRNPGRVMRLAGTIAWPTKPGRIVERTEIRRPGDRIIPPYMPEAVARAYPPIPEERAKIELGEISYTTAASDGLGLGDKIADGRERYMRNTVLACLIEYIGTHGACPTAQELFDAAWPQYSRRVDFRRPGRGPEEVLDKCRRAISRFEAGRIRGARTLEEAVESYQNKTYERPEPEVLKEERATTALPLIWFKDITAATDPEDFVEDLLCRQQMSVVYGDTNCGKTFFMLDLALHVALGRRWRDRETEQGGVIYCVLEGSNGFERRVLAFKKHQGLEGVDLPFATVPSAINLLDPKADTDRLIQSIEDAATQIAVPVKLIVIDTLARAMAGGNENSSEDMGALVMNADRVRAATKAHFCFIHHSGKDQAKGARGHSSLRAATDTEIELRRDESAEMSVAKVTKQRELEVSGEFWFRLASVPIGINRRGNPVTSCIVQPVEAEQQSWRPKMTPTERKAIEILAATIAEIGFHPAASTDMPNVPVTTLDQWRRALAQHGVTDEIGTSIQRAQFSRIRKDLVTKGLICVLGGHVWPIVTAQQGATEA